MNMPRKSTLTAATAAAALVLPAAVADGARPAKGVYENSSASNGVRLETTRHNIRTISFFCKRTRFTLIDFVRVRRDGSFRHRGRFKQYGPESQYWGTYRGSFSGRFTSRRSVRIKRKLPSCGTARVKAKRG